MGHAGVTVECEEIPQRTEVCLLNCYLIKLFDQGELSACLDTNDQSRKARTTGLIGDVVQVECDRCCFFNSQDETAVFERCLGQGKTMGLTHRVETTLFPRKKVRLSD